MQVVDFDSMHQKILLDAPSASPAFDVYSWEFSWLGEMVGAKALRPLDDFVQRDAAMLNVDDIPKANWDATVWEGKRYGIPVQPHAELTWWRTDLLDAAGLKPPTNTDELLAAAKALHKPDQGQYGFLWKGARGAPLGQTMPILSPPIMTACGVPVSLAMNTICSQTFLSESSSCFWNCSHGTGLE